MVVEGDIRDCFGSLDQDILVGIMAEKIHDQRFLRLVRNMLRAGYLEAGNTTKRSAAVRKAGWYRGS